MMVGICLFVMVWGEKLSMEMMRQGLAELPWLPVGYTYLPLPIGSFLTLLFVLENALPGLAGTPCGGHLRPRRGHSCAGAN